jgi:two-component system sensor histidine kinase KdpD
LEDIQATLIATVSHDLRTPLAAAKTAIDCLTDPTIRLTTKNQADLLATTHASLAQISRLVEGLLDANRIRHCAGAATLLPTKLLHVVRAALATIPGAERLVIDVPADLPDVITDPMLLERVIANVVANALRHSPPGLPPRLVADRRKCRVELRVIDRGPGVPRARWAQLFRPYERLCEARTGTGLGLGLAISQTLAGAMGSALSPEATGGGGLTMLITLPLVHPGHQDARD